MPRSAPASVHVVAVIQYLTGMLMVLAGVLAGVIGVGGGRYVDEYLPADGRDAIAGTGLAVGALLVFVGLLAIALGRKLQRGRRWARLLVLLLSALSVAVTLYNGVVAGRTANALFGLVFPVLFLVLLNFPAARSWFRSRTY